MHPFNLGLDGCCFAGTMKAVSLTVGQSASSSNLMCNQHVKVTCDKNSTCKRKHDHDNNDDTEQQTKTRKSNGFCDVGTTMDFIDVPKRLVGRLMGMRGTTIATIAQRSGTFINARDQSQDPVKVKITGPAECIKMAKELIWAIVLDEDAVRQSTGVVLNIPIAKIGKVIGVRGTKIQEIKMDTGAKINISKDCNPCRVHITGQEENIVNATRLILTMTRETISIEH